MTDKIEQAAKIIEDDNDAFLIATFRGDTVDSLYGLTGMIANINPLHFSLLLAEVAKNKEYHKVIKLVGNMSPKRIKDMEKLAVKDKE